MHHQQQQELDQVANARVARLPDVPPPPPYQPTAGETPPLWWLLETFAAGTRSLWVGGRITRAGQLLTFQANSANQTLAGAPAWPLHVPLNAIRDVRHKAALVTGRVQCPTDTHLFEFRCRGAKGVAEQVRGAWAAG